MKIIKRFEKFVNESTGLPLNEIIENCEDILLDLNVSTSQFTTKIFCHELGLSNPKYLGFIKRTSGIIGYQKDNSILFHIKSSKKFEYEDIQDIIERLKSYLSEFGYEIEFLSAWGEESKTPEISSHGETNPDIIPWRTTSTGKFEISTAYTISLRFRIP